MNVDAITLDLVKQTLASWQKVEDLPADIWQLDLLRQFGSVGKAELSLLFYDYVRDLVETRLQEQRFSEGLTHPSHPPMTRAGITAVLAQDFRCNNRELESWSALYHTYFVPFPPDESILEEVLPISPRHYRRRVQTGLNRLTDLLRRAEMDAHHQYQTEHRRRHLPPPDYLTLFGADDQLQRLTDLLTTPDAFTFVSVEGLGGIGKTSLARAVAHQLAGYGHWQDILWISAKQQWLGEQGDLHSITSPARTLDDIVTSLADQLGQQHLAGLDTSDKLARLMPLLKSTPYLIIIDNLETVADVDVLLPALQPLAGDTRFLLTSRQSVGRYPFVQTIPVPELGLADSQALVESELQRRGKPVTIDHHMMNRLYQFIGGLPLALKLMAAQLSRRSLDEVLEQLQMAKTNTPYGLYTFIYRQTWELLGDPARLLLLSALDIAPDGDTMSWLRRMSDLPDVDFDKALDQLIDFSLIEVGGMLGNRVYRLHRLTVTFLQTDILGGWMDDDNEI